MAFRHFLEKAEWQNDALRYFPPLLAAFCHFPPVTNSSSVIYPFLLTFLVFYKCFDFTLMALHGLCGLMCF